MTLTAVQAQATPALPTDQAKEYDHIILVDQSGSMGSPSTKMEGRTRWQEAQEFTESYARYVEQFDEDGLTVITFNSRATVYDNVKTSKVSELFTANYPGGSTNLAAALDAAFAKKFASGKKTVVLCMTDGAPDSQSAVKSSIVGAANRLEADEQLAIQFVQIGDDPAAAKFLTDLDDNLKEAKFDIVNSLSREDAEALRVDQLLYVALND